MALILLLFATTVILSAGIDDEGHTSAAILPRSMRGNNAVGKPNNSNDVASIEGDRIKHAAASPNEDGEEPLRVGPYSSRPPPSISSFSFSLMADTQARSGRNGSGEASGADPDVWSVLFEGATNRAASPGMSYVHNAPSPRGGLLNEITPPIEDLRPRTDAPSYAEADPVPRERPATRPARLPTASPARPPPQPTAMADPRRTGHPTLPPPDPTLSPTHGMIGPVPGDVPTGPGTGPEASSPGPAPPSGFPAADPARGDGEGGASGPAGGGPPVAVPTAVPTAVAPDLDDAAPSPSPVPPGPEASCDPPCRSDELCRGGEGAGCVDRCHDDGDCSSDRARPPPAAADGEEGPVDVCLGDGGCSRTRSRAAAKSVKGGRSADVAGTVADTLRTTSAVSELLQGKGRRPKRRRLGALCRRGECARGVRV